MTLRRARLLTGALLLILTAAAAPAAGQAADWPSERPPAPLPAREVKFPPYATRTLPNGLQVIAVSHHEQPAVSLRLLIRAGGAQDPADKPGVASLMASLLDQGTATRSAEQIAQTIDFIGGVMGTGSGTDLTFVNAVVLKDSFDVALDLVSDVVRNTAFDPQEVELQRKQMLSGLLVSYDDPDYLANVVFERLVYGFHPYGRPSGGTPESIAAITRDDLVAFHKAWFGANNAILAIVGDVTTEEAFAGAARAFGSWGAAGSTAVPPPPPPPPTRRLVLVDRPGAVQTEIRAGHTALPRRHPDYLALDLAVKILGGEGGNRLQGVLRTDRGLTYGASASLRARQEAGSIVADTDTRSDTTAQALRLLVDEMWRLQRQRVSERELSYAQAYLTGNFPLTIETPSAIALQILNAVFYGLDLEELQTFRERVNAVTVEDIQRVAKAYLHPDRLSIVLVGDASVFQKQLGAAGFDQFERIPIGELDLNSPSLRRRSPTAARRTPGVRPALPSARVVQPVAAAYATPAPISPAALEGVRPLAEEGKTPRADVRALVDRAVRGKGGLERLRSVRTIHAESDTLIETQDGTVAVPTTIRVMYPGGFRIDAEMPTGAVAQVFDSGTYWVKDARGVSVAPDEAAAAMRSNVQRDPIALLVALADGRVSARQGPDVSIDGRMMPVLLVDLKPAGPLSLVLHPDTGHILRTSYPAPGTSGKVEEAFSDYRDVDGVQVAFSVTVRHPGLPPFRRIMRQFQVNVPLDSSLFAKPI
jgi:zinc protease